MLVFECVVQVQQPRVVQLVHYIDLVSNGYFVRRLWSVDEFRDKIVASRSFDAAVDDAKSAATENRTNGRMK